MALKDPRPTQYRLRWHKEKLPDGTPKWYGEMGGVRVAEAVMTGVSGRDTYPWEWYLTDAGESLRRKPGRSSQTIDTLRAAKETVDMMFRPN